MHAAQTNERIGDIGIAPDSLPTRVSLLHRLRNLGDAESWQTFFEMYWRLLYNVARKSGLQDPEAQDVVQETVISVARQMPGFSYDPAKGSFKQWLLLITRRRIQDHLRRVYRSLPAAPPGSEPAAEHPESEAAATIEAAWESEWRENIYQAALTQVRQQVNPKHYQIFEACVLQGVRSPKVAQAFGVSVAQVYLARHRVSAAVKRAALAIEAELNRSGTK